MEDSSVAEVIATRRFADHHGVYPGVGLVARGGQRVAAIRHMCGWCSPLRPGHTLGLSMLVKAFRVGQESRGGFPPSVTFFTVPEEAVYANPQAVAE